ncbi:MAG: hypothetical protein WA954_00475 [Parerythrobacter sp.]
MNSASRSSQMPAAVATTSAITLASSPNAPPDSSALPSSRASTSPSTW